MAVVLKLLSFLLIAHPHMDLSHLENPETVVRNKLKFLFSFSRLLQIISFPVNTKELCFKEIISDYFFRVLTAYHFRLIATVNSLKCEI